MRKKSVTRSVIAHHRVSATDRSHSRSRAARHELDGDLFRILEHAVGRIASACVHVPIQPSGSPMKPGGAHRAAESREECRIESGARSRMPATVGVVAGHFADSLYRSMSGQFLRHCSTRTRPPAVAIAPCRRTAGG
jgi:hypothetical protein